YKTSTEANQAAFPEGLYFMEKNGPVFGYIQPQTKIVTNLWGNQNRSSTPPVTGTAISKNLSMSMAIANGAAMPLMFDSSGLPWLRVDYALVSVDSSNKVVVKTTAATTYLAQMAANNANPVNYGLGYYSGTQNFALKNNGLFIMPNSVQAGYDPIISIRYMDFTNLVMPIIIGGNYLSSSNSAASADIATPGNVAVAPLWTSCRNAGGCYMQYQAGSDRLYFSENNKVRYITSPDNTATATLGTLYTAASQIGNISFTPDGSQLWYFRGGSGLYCHDISSGKSWCDDTTDHYAIRTAAGFTYTAGPNQITWKDNQTMFLSTYNGLILQFNLPTGP
ncbi:MAG: hypothetical protein ACM3MG_09180, partial [Bacillota bacterium]